MSRRAAPGETQPGDRAQPFGGLEAAMPGQHDGEEPADA